VREATVAHNSQQGHAQGFWVPTEFIRGFNRDTLPVGLEHFRPQMVKEIQGHVQGAHAFQFG
jgi:hypothetical protein